MMNGLIVAAAEDDEFSKSEDLFFRHFSTNVEVKLIKS
jgi:hypothetical protein